MASSGKAREAFSARPPNLLTIAGSDPSGGAGIQADLKTFSSLGCYGMSIITSLTAQNTCGVTSIHIPPVEFFRQQLRSLWEDIEIDAIKVGMLGDRSVILALAEELRQHEGKKCIVLDPVMVSTSGSLLLTKDSIEDLIKTLLPLCTILTPNLPEAVQLLTRAGGSTETRSISTLDDMLQAAEETCNLGPAAALLKGGHQILKQSEVARSLKDLEAISSKTRYTEYPGAEKSECPISTVVPTKTSSWMSCMKRRITHSPSSSSHTSPRRPLTGQGALSLLQSQLSQRSMIPSLRSTYYAIQYVQQSISRGLAQLGKGAGPLNHLCHTSPRPILAPSTADSNRYPICSRLVSHSLPHWRAYTQHDFLRQMVFHTLPKESFIYFLKQDYLFLKNYARVWASGASSFSVGNTFSRIATFAGIAFEMANEADHHVKICEPWGITKHQLDHETVESAATLAYTRFVLDVARSGDALELLAATGPCMLGYGEAGLWLEAQRKRRGSDGKGAGKYDPMHGFEQWIDYYSGEEFQTIVQQGMQNMEEYACSDPPSVSRMANLQRIWDAAVRLEVGMWDEALHLHLRREVFHP